MKRIIALSLILLITIVMLLCIPSHAEEVPVPAEDAAADVAATNSPKEEPLSQVATDWFSAHFSDITGAVCSVGLLVIAWFFKKGLIPSVNTVLQGIAKKSEESHGAFLKETQSVRTVLELGGKYLDDCSNRIDGMIKDWQAKSAAQSKAYELQTDLINYLMMNLRIPNELKAEIAERSAAVKKAIEEASKEA